MPHLSPQTLTEAEQHALLQATVAHPRDRLVFSLALGASRLTVGLPPWPVRATVPAGN